MTGRVTAARRGHATIQLDAAHRTPGESPSVTLPAAYVGTHVEYSYARTVDTAQGATVDHSLFTPSNSASAERAYVALSRGWLTNRIYATRDQTWIDALGRDRSHALAVDQSPDIHPTIHRALRRRPATRDQERHPPLELDL